MRHSFSGCLRWALLSTALLLSGCPYYAEHPLGSPADAVAAEDLVGTWRVVNEDADPLVVVIRGAGDRKYLITAQEPGSEPFDPLPAFVSVLGGERFLNIWDEEGQWYLAKCWIAGQTLRLKFLDDELLEPRTFASPQDLRQFVLAHLADPRLYGEADEPSIWDWVLEPVEPAPPAGAVPPAATSP